MDIAICGTKLVVPDGACVRVIATRLVAEGLHGHHRVAIHVALGPFQKFTLGTHREIERERERLSIIFSHLGLI